MRVLKNIFHTFAMQIRFSLAINCNNTFFAFLQESAHDREPPSPLSALKYTTDKTFTAPHLKYTREEHYSLLEHFGKKKFPALKFIKYGFC